MGNALSPSGTALSVPPQRLGPDGSAVYLAACEQTALDAVLDVAEVMLDGRVTAIERISSVTNFVFALRTDTGETFLAKYSFLGVAKTTLRHFIESDGLLAVLSRQHQFPHEQSPIESESQQVEYLNRWLPGLAPELVGYRSGVLLEEYVPAATALSTALMQGDAGLARSLRAVGEIARSVWSLSAAPEAVAAAERLHAAKRRVDPVATFDRKFGAATADVYVQRIGRRHSLPPGLHDLVRWLTGRLAAVRSGLRQDAVVVGDLKPEHVLCQPGKPEVRLVDPGVHLGDPRVDVARFLCRAYLPLLVCESADHWAVLDAAAEELMDGCQRYVPVRADELLALVMADAVNILSTYCTVRLDDSGMYDATTQPVVAMAATLLAGLYAGWQRAPATVPELMHAWRAAVASAG